MGDPPVSPLLVRLPAEDLARVLDAAHRRRFAKGEVVFHEGDPGDTLHLIAKGKFIVRVSTLSGETATLAVLREGEFFGELALLRKDARRTATIVCLESGETLSIDRPTLDALRAAHPEVTEVLLSIVSDKVTRYTEQLLEALYLPADLRVLRRLLELATIYTDGEIPLTQEDLSGLAGTSRATVNRVLREEEDRGSLKLARGRVRIVDESHLRVRARL